MAQLLLAFALTEPAAPRAVAAAAAAASEGEQRDGGSGDAANAPAEARVVAPAAALCRRARDLLARFVEAIPTGALADQARELLEDDTSGAGRWCVVDENEAAGATAGAVEVPAAAAMDG